MNPDAAWQPEQVRGVAARIRSAPPKLGRSRLVLIDGPTGSGKTTYAQLLANVLGPDVEVVHTDDLLDGWDDQFTYWSRLERQVLRPLRQEGPGQYRPYDWHTGRFNDWSITVRPADVVIVEGVGAGRADGRAWATLTVFVDAPEEVRQARTMARDGETIEPFLRVWRLRERSFFAADGTEAAADLVITSDGKSAGTA